MLAARLKLPAVYWERFLVAAGGLMSYGPDLVEQFRQAAGYVDRILKGEQRRWNFEAERLGGLEVENK